MALEPIVGRPVNYTKIDYRTWVKYKETTFYSISQTWIFDNNIGDAIIGIGPKDCDYHVVVRIQNRIHEMRGKNASLKTTLEEMGYLLVIP